MVSGSQATLEAEMTDKSDQEALTGQLADTVAWIKGSEMDRAVTYVERGRSHQSLSNAELFERWKFAATEVARDMISEENRAVENDLKAEIDLRGLVPPWEAVKDVLADALKQFVDRMRREDPAWLVRFEEHLVGNAADFKAKKQSSEN